MKTPNAWADRSDLIFRSLFSLIFIVGGAGHFGQHEVMLTRLEGSPWLSLVNSVASPSLLLYMSGVTLLLGGIALLFGFFARQAALLLLVTLIPITFVIHIAPDHVGPLLKNVAIMGGLIHFFVHGPGAYSIDSKQQ